MKEVAGKVNYRLIPPQALKATAEVMTFGNTKYSPFSWVEVPAEQYIDALYRHVEAARNGELYDKESGLLHLAHAATNLMFLLDKQIDEGDNNIVDFATETNFWYNERRKETDHDNK